jgi:hypothetical protein
LSIFAYWDRLETGATVHPDDLAILGHCEHAFQTDLPPGHISGPLRSAPVVLCYGNPGYDDADRLAVQDSAKRALLTNQMSGTDPYPMWLPGWKKWITERTKKINLPSEILSHTVATFNVVPYASVQMSDAQNRIAGRLPSVHAARRYLHQTLIPRAQKGEIFLVIVRKHRLWQVDDVTECRTLRVPRNIYVGGALGGIGREIRSWLDDSGRLEHAL